MILINLFGGPGIGKTVLLNDEFATYDKSRWNDNLTYSYQSDLTINDCHRSALINVVNQRHIRRREFWDSLY